MSLRFSAADAAEWRQNWKVVFAAACGFALMNLPPHSIGIFIAPLEAEFGWKRSIIASGLMFTAGASVLLGPVVGTAVDRFGSRRIALTGSIFVCATFASFSTINKDPWSWLMLWALLACSFVMIMPMVWGAAISSLFKSSRGFALAVALCGTAVTSATLPLISTIFIQDYGWRAAFAGIAALYAVIVIPAVFLFFTSAIDRARAAPEVEVKVESALPGLGAREAILSFRYLRLILASTAMVAVPSVTSSIIPIMTSFNHSPMQAAAIASLIGVAGFVGRISAGYLIDRVNGNVVAAACMTMPIAGILLMLEMPHSVAAFAAAAIIMGTCVGAELDAVAFLTTRHFGLRSFALLLAIISALQFVCMAAGPIALNYAFDVTGSYRQGMWSAIPICAVGAVLFFTLGKYRFTEGHVEGGGHG